MTREQTAAVLVLALALFGVYAHRRAPRKTAHAEIGEIEVIDWSGDPYIPPLGSGYGF